MKNILVYKLRNSLAFTQQMVDEIERLKFTTCGTNEAKRVGFSNTVDGTLVSNIAGNTVLNIATQEKKPEKAEADLRLKARKFQYKEKFGKDPKKTEVDTMKAEIYRDLLPLTFPKAVKNHTVFFTKDNLLYVEAASWKKADEIVGLLRRVMGSLPCTPVTTIKHTDEVMGEFISKPIDDKITLGEKAVLITEDEYKINISKGDIRGSKATDLVKEGAFVDSLELEYDGMIIFTLKSDMSIGGVKYANELFLDAEEDKVGSFTIMIDEITKMFAELSKEFGGIEQ